MVRLRSSEGRDKMKTINFLGGFMIGVFMGGFAALLLTPKDGELMRQDVKGFIGGLRQEYDEAVNSRREELSADLERRRAG